MALKQYMWRNTSVIPYPCEMHFGTLFLETWKFHAPSRITGVAGLTAISILQQLFLYQLFTPIYAVQLRPDYIEVSTTENCEHYCSFGWTS